MNYRIEVLRGRILSDERALEIQRRPLELAIALATHSGTLSTGALYALMYPDLDEDTAAVRLRVNASRLRDVAPGLLAHARGGTYALEECIVDINEIARALRTSQGPGRFLSLLQALSAFADAGSDRLTQRWSWATATEARIEALRTDTCADLNKMVIPIAHADETLFVARALLAIDPLDEEAYILAVRALSALERRIDALRLYKEYERAMRIEYDAEPSFALAYLTGRTG